MGKTKGAGGGEEDERHLVYEYIIMRRSPVAEKGEGWMGTYENGSKGRRCPTTARAHLLLGWRARKKQAGKLAWALRVCVSCCGSGGEKRELLRYKRGDTGTHTHTHTGAAHDDALKTPSRNFSSSIIWPPDRHKPPPLVFCFPPSHCPFDPTHPPHYPITTSLSSQRSWWC